MVGGVLQSLPMFRVVAAVCVLVAGLAAAYWLLLGREEDEVVSLAPGQSGATGNEPASRPVQLVVKATSGTIKKKDAAGTEVVLAPGDPVSLQDELTTGADSGLTLGSEGSTIELGAETRLAVRGIEGNALQFLVDGGSVSASSAGERLEFFGTGTTGRVRVENAAARLLSDGAKSLIVASERGEVLVENAGQKLTLAPGHATRVVGERAPDKLWKVPASMMLKVAWPKDSELATRRVRVTGKATPHSLVRVRNVQLGNGGGVRAIVDENGNFTLELPLAEGQNGISLQNDDVMGKRQESKTKIKVDTTPAEVGVETSPDMWKKKP